MLMSGGVGTGYLDTKGKPTDVGEFTLDTGLDAALQFNLAEFGVWVSTHTYGFSCVFRPTFYTYFYSLML